MATAAAGDQPAGPDQAAPQALLPRGSNEIRVIDSHGQSSATDDERAAPAAAPGLGRIPGWAGGGGSSAVQTQVLWIGQRDGLAAPGAGIVMMTRSGQ